MKRTRKWSYVEQEAKRLAALGLTAADIAKRLGVHKATIGRWMAAGKLDRRIVAKRIQGQTPAQWAASVRKDYALDATDSQLVTLAERSLEMSLDPSIAPHVRMNAAGRFQGIVRQLALVTRLADAGAPPADKPKQAVQPVAAPTRQARTDPRGLLMAVK